nr:MAG TPA: hypothetical protein [Caudoviricetes sp.]
MHRQLNTHISLKNAVFLGFFGFYFRNLRLGTHTRWCVLAGL